MPVTKHGSPPSPEQQSANAICRFGLRLFASVCAEKPATNIVLSPLVVAGALSLAVAGATPGGSAEREILEALGTASHSEFAALSSAVLSGAGATVRSANGVFPKASIKPEYLGIVHSVHAAEAAELTDTYEPINAWVEAKTEGYVKGLLEGKPGPLVVALLVSVVFFKGSWASKFDPTSTRQGPFRLLDGTSLPTQMMHRTASMPASPCVDALGGASVVRLDYGDGSKQVADYCALLVLPESEGVAKLDATVHKLMGAPPLKLLSELRTQNVKLTMPKVKASYGPATLEPALRSLGLAASFDGNSIFGGMSDDPTVHIDDVLTKAVLEIDEEGTVAAAAGAARMMSRCMPPPPLDLTFDRPFLLAIVHMATGVPLFLARINTPA